MKQEFLEQALRLVSRVFFFEYRLWHDELPIQLSGTPVSLAALNQAICVDRPLWHGKTADHSLRRSARIIVASVFTSFHGPSGSFLELT